jgi:hypothetical protein
MVDPERLAEMRAYAAEVREDLERREQDPANWPELRRDAPQMIFKTHDNASVYANAAPASPLNNDELIDTIAETLAEEGDEIRREFEARIAKLEGQIEMLTSLLAGDPTRAKAIRKSLRNDTQLIEGPSTRHNA